jgi:hypothetical protein
MTQVRHALLLLLSLAIAAPSVRAQATLADYQRAMTLRDTYQPLALDIVDQVNWVGSSSRCWYRKTVEGGSEFMLVDATTLAKTPAFDHARLAAAISAAAGGKYTAVTLPFNTYTFV